jgi:hypothetical protein
MQQPGQADAVMMQSGGQAGLSEEHFNVFRTIEILGKHPLEDNVTNEALRPHPAGDEDLAHTPLGNLMKEQVIGELIASSCTHSLTI